MGDYKFKDVSTQIAATVVVSLSCFCCGIAFGYPAVLIGQLKNIGNITSGDEFETITDKDASWIGSIGSLSTMMISPFLACLPDRFGRLKTVRLMILPLILGALLTSVSKNVATLLVGRALTISTTGLIVSASAVYVTEISVPLARGQLLSFKYMAMVLGISLAYLQGNFVHWRSIAYGIVASGSIFLILSMFIPESVAWLNLKRETDRAEKSAKWFRLPLPVVNTPDKPKFNFKDCRKPILYKPAVFISALYLMQELSGINVIMVNLVTFINDFGTAYDPFTISSYVALAKLVTMFANSWLMLKFRRRPLMMVSFVGMSVTICVSATFTLLNRNGSFGIRWIPPTMIIAYVIFANVGVVFLPYLVSAELCPNNVRGTYQSVNTAIGQLLTFGIFHLYYVIKKYCTSWQIQYYFGLMSVLGFLYVYVFLPETHNKTLDEIESNWLKSSPVKSQQTHLLQRSL